MTDKIIQILVNGGLASVALVSLYLNYRIVGNHLDHLNRALIELTAILAKLKQVIEDKLRKK